MNPVRILTLFFVGIHFNIILPLVNSLQNDPFLSDFKPKNFGPHLLCPPSMLHNNLLDLIALIIGEEGAKWGREAQWGTLCAAPVWAHNHILSIKTASGWLQ
jgi:hypothetical protein